MSNSKEELSAKIEAYLQRFDPVEFNTETSGDRAKTLADGLADELMSA